jgi:hypothetical protein
MNYSVTMAELETHHARFVKITAVSTSAKNVLADVFIVKHVLLNFIHLTHYIGLRYVSIYQLTR